MLRECEVEDPVKEDFPRSSLSTRLGDYHVIIPPDASIAAYLLLIAMPTLVTTNLNQSSYIIVRIVLAAVYGYGRERVPSLAPSRNLLSALP